MGQMKLLISEIDFLSDFARHGDTVVYAGAADGRHIPTLDGMFASLKLCWNLFDPARFSHPVMAWSRDCRDRVCVFRRCFGDADAIYYKGFRRVLLISDIRSNHHEKEDHPDDACIMQDQEWQMQWVKLMEPEACCLKFRGPFGYAECERYRHFNYMDGELRLQVRQRGRGAGTGPFLLCCHYFRDFLQPTWCVLPISCNHHNSAFSGMAASKQLGGSSGGIEAILRKDVRQRAIGPVHVVL
jgi:hypothetical protein